MRVRGSSLRGIRHVLLHTGGAGAEAAALRTCSVAALPVAIRTVRALVVRSLIVRRAPSRRSTAHRQRLAVPVSSPTLAVPVAGETRRRVGEVCMTVVKLKKGKCLLRIIIQRRLIKLARSQSRALSHSAAGGAQLIESTSSVKSRVPGEGEGWG